MTKPRTVIQGSKIMFTELWAFLWPPIDNSPIEPPAAPKTASPAEKLFGNPSDAIRLPEAIRIPPHQRFLKVPPEERWAQYASFKLPKEPKRGSSRKGRGAYRA